nr:transcription factor IIIB 60 kDa subunit [Tanacetum cinerariifolium]
MTEVVCQHKSSAVQSGFGLCKNCYLEFCGGLDGLEPPAFQRAEMERLAIESAETSESMSGIEPRKNDNAIGTQHNGEPRANGKSADRGLSRHVECTSPTLGKLESIRDNVDAFESSKDVSDTVDETDTLSEIDDNEVSCYINNKEESDFKKIIWEHLNKEYMQEQAAKEAAAAAARKLYTGTPEEIEATVLAAATAAAVASKRQKEKAKRALEAKNAKPAQTAAEAAGQHFTKK